MNRKQQIGAMVWGLHVLVIVSFFIHHAASKPVQINRPIAVRTVIPQAAAPAAIKPQPAKPQARAEPPKAVAKVAKKPAPAAKKEPPSQLASVLKALETAEKKPAAKVPSVEIPSLIQIHQPLEAVSSLPSYSAILLAYLQSHLDLPEMGEVKMTLKISAEGAVLESSVVTSENPRNSEFLKNRLPELTLPCFNDFGIREKTLTFTISFRNAENFR